MKRPNPFKEKIRAGLAAGVVAILVCSMASAVWASETKGQTKEKKPEPHKAHKPEHSGAELYEMNCNRCHPERYPMEHTDAQWKTIMLHMRTRAQIPADDAKAIMKYLKESN